MEWKLKGEFSIHILHHHYYYRINNSLSDWLTESKKEKKLRGTLYIAFTWSSCLHGIGMVCVYANKKETRKNLVLMKKSVFFWLSHFPFYLFSFQKKKGTLESWASFTQHYAALFPCILWNAGIVSFFSFKLFICHYFFSLLPPPPLCC